MDGYSPGNGVRLSLFILSVNLMGLMWCLVEIRLNEVLRNVIVCIQLEGLAYLHLVYCSGNAGSTFAQHTTEIEYVLRPS